MKITRKDKIGEWLDSLAEWLGIAPKPIPVRIPKKKGRRR